MHKPGYNRHKTPISFVHKHLLPILHYEYQSLFIPFFYSVLWHHFSPSIYILLNIGRNRFITQPTIMYCLWNHIYFLIFKRKSKRYTCAIAVLPTAKEFEEETSDKNKIQITQALNFP